MNTATKLAAFAAGLVLTFAAAAGAGAVAGPIRSTTAPSTGHADNHGAVATASPTPAASTSAAGLPGGLVVSQEGYTLDLDDQTTAAGDQVPLSLRVLGPDGLAVTRYQTDHEQDLHLIVVRRDMTGYQHVHPFMSPDGTWSAAVDLQPGQWRVFADFTPVGADRSLTLGTDLAVAGAYRPEPLPAPAPVVEVDGYEVRLDGTLVPGRVSTLTLTVTKAGQPVTDLQPYLGAYGHLVALRDGDLAYLHAHPGGTAGDTTTAPGPRVAFDVSAPTAGSYALFLDFRHGDVVRTAQFTARADGAAAAAGPAGGHGGTHGH